MTAHLDRSDGVAWITIDRPDVRNAFDAALIAKLIELLNSVGSETRAVVLQSEGPVFCGGADVNWMRAIGAGSRQANVEDAQELAGLFAQLDGIPVPLIARVQGPALGGGVGLVAVADIAIASRAAWFQFAEVRVGIVPAVVSPYVVRKVGPAFATAAFVSAEKFDADRAFAAGLVHRVVEPSSLDAVVAETLADIRKGSP